MSLVGRRLVLGSEKVNLASLGYRTLREQPSLLKIEAEGRRLNGINTGACGENRTESWKSLCTNTTQGTHPAVVTGSSAFLALPNSRHRGILSPILKRFLINTLGLQKTFKYESIVDYGSLSCSRTCNIKHGVAFASLSDVFVTGSYALNALRNTATTRRVDTQRAHSQGKER
ncbi:hypothetical protein ARMGADRAFT_1062627 [Armillaria gallica]|uniref:Uncharacterized protein n=1 Tax=Armillaria gallica TaxID=47427 RepID=A0A2H3DKX0_ARMGA|nr:hypothetical protein ARMGADRAFT_1062627 [Armillaria gallica]